MSVSRPTVGVLLALLADSPVLQPHFYLDDFTQRSEPLSDQPMPHTHVNIAEALRPTTRATAASPSRTAQGDAAAAQLLFDSSSDFGGVDPAQALRMDGFDAPRSP